MKGKSNSLIQRLIFLSLFGYFAYQHAEVKDSGWTVQDTVLIEQTGMVKNARYKLTRGSYELHNEETGQYVMVETDKPTPENGTALRITGERLSSNYKGRLLLREIVRHTYAPKENYEISNEDYVRHGPSGTLY